MQYKNLRWLLPVILLAWLWSPVSAAMSETRPAWDTVEQPFISSVRELEDGRLEVYILGVVGENGGDQLVVILYDRGGVPVLRQVVEEEKDRHTLLFTPEAPGNYSFQAELRRAEEMPKASATVSVAYGLPLGKPEILSAQEQEKGSVQLQWTAVEEATGYEVLLDGNALVQVDQLTYSVTDLTPGASYTFQVVALRGSERTVSDGVTVTLSGHTEHSYSEEWYAEDDRFHWHACQCGERSDQAEHSWLWVVDREATPGKSGLRHRECKVCGYESSFEEIPFAQEAQPENPNLLWFWIVAGAVVVCAAAWLVIRTGRKKKRRRRPVSLSS